MFLKKSNGDKMKAKKIIKQLALLGFCSSMSFFAHSSSITLYGIINAGVGDIRTSGKDSSGNYIKRKTTGFVDQGFYGNQFGLKGVEDITGQLKAIFQLESGFSLATGGSYQGGRLFGRQATVGLRHSQFGQLEFGRQTNMTFKAIGNMASPFGGNGWQVGIGATIPAANVVRYDNLILYQTPNWNGFQAGVGYSFNTDGSQFPRTSEGVSLDEANIKATTIGMSYQSGDFAMGFGFEQNDYGSLRSTATGFVPREAGKVNTWNLGARYDFKRFKIHAGIGQSRNGMISPSLVDAQYGVGYREGLRFNSYLLGVTVPVGASNDLLASVGLIDPRSVPEGGQAAMQRAYNLGWMTHMSKRTSIYALAGYAEKVGFYNDMKASFYTVGLAHKF